MKIIIFDYDGTIADSLKYVAKGAFNCAAEKYGIKKRNEKEVAELYANNIFSSIIKLGIPKKDAIKFVTVMRKEYVNYNIGLFPHMREVINRLEKKNKVFIISSNFGKIIRKSMKTNHIRINVILGAEWGTSKVEKLNLVKKKYPNSEIYYIGDTVGDIKETREAKATSIAVTWGYHTRKMLLDAEPDFIVNKPRDLLRVLK